MECQAAFLCYLYCKQYLFCKVQDYVVIIGRSKSRGTLTFWSSQDAANTCRLVLLHYFLSLLITLLCCVAKQQMRHCCFASHSLLDWVFPSGIIKKKYKNLESTLDMFVIFNEKNYFGYSRNSSFVTAAAHKDPSPIKQ